MILETIKSARRLAARRPILALVAVVALACPACASKDKVASGQPGGMSMMAPPPLTAAYDPSKQVATSSGSPWGASGAGMPSGMPTASANGNGSSYNR